MTFAAVASVVFAVVAELEGVMELTVDQKHNVALSLFWILKSYCYNFRFGKLKWRKGIGVRLLRERNNRTVAGVS